MVNESVACLHEGVIGDPDLLDAGVIFGTGFAPFRGGPLQYARSEGVDTIVARLTALESRHGIRFAPHPGWRSLPRR
jgi:3-hydroxyacyl-CoA dehydrogenase/enoyl-CoA hydratase/3-hydroxybutyryl-CoA epimerase